MEQTLTVERLHELMDYNSETGTFIRRQKLSNRANLEKDAAQIAFNGRKYVSVLGKSYLAHRLAWFYVTGSWPTKNIAVIDGDYENLKFNNLREETPSETARKSSCRSDNTSGIKGVSWDKSRNKWIAYKTQDYKVIHLGRFDTKEEAAKAVAEAEVIQVNPEERKQNAEKIKIKARQKQIWKRTLQRFGGITDWLSFEDFCKSIGEGMPLTYEIVVRDQTKNVGPNNFVWDLVTAKRFDTSTREGRIAYSRQHRKENRNLYKNKELYRYFGITLIDYQRMFDEQNGVCDICKKPETAIRQGKLLTLAVDHNHTTGKVRGLLCTNCNIAIGNLKDDESLLSSAIAYLRKHKKVTNEV